MEFAFEVNWYVAACILTFINQIASPWSPETGREARRAARNPAIEAQES